MPKIEEIIIPKNIQKEIKKLPKDIQKRLEKRLEMLKENPYYPSLNFHRYHTAREDGIFWEFYINHKYRGILLQELDENGEPTNRFYLVAVSVHDIVEKFQKLL